MVAIMMTTKKLTGCARISRIKRLKKDLKKHLYDWNHMQRRSSFSGIHAAGQIDKIQQELERLGDKSKRHYITVDIEIG